MKAIRVLTFLFLLLFITRVGMAQEIAVTERGDSVVLYANGVWDYYDNYINNKEELEEIRANKSSFLKPKTANKKINGSNQAYQIWYDDKKWKRVPTGGINDEADIALQLLKGDVYAMIIYEELEIPKENLSQLALDNAVAVAPDIKMIDREKRSVNNDTLVWMRMDGTMEGMKISYYSYYSSSKNGSIQFHTFTGQNLIGRYIQDIEELLNGLVISKD